MEKQKYTDINAVTISNWAKNGWEWGLPISHEEYLRAQQGEWHILLTATKYVPREWFPPLGGKKILGLAAGGGQQMPVFAAQGALCTLLDYADAQLETERAVAEREAYPIEIIKADMTERLPFDDGIFDMIFHPVSNCYVEDVLHIWRECYRVLKKGGLLLAGMDNGLNFMFDDVTASPLVVVNKLPFNPLRDPELYKKLDKANDGIQFSHSLEEQIGGQLKAGFILTDLYEDHDRTGLLREYAPQYIATRAIKPR
ncbi:MAG: class I SAM-dependent methyltransferase [Treponema sp.]|jgi:SAM-dependent methyltransferase|nr:class I SAM-dependent methyltransferase [Treponema sp.]